MYLQTLLMINDLQEVLLSCTHMLYDLLLMLPGTGIIFELLLINFVIPNVVTGVLKNLYNFNYRTSIAIIKGQYKNR